MEGANPEAIRRFFYVAEVGIGAALLLAFVLFARSRDQSGFKVREADRFKPAGGQPAAPKAALKHDSLGEAKMKRNEPLRLTGIAIDGLPHQILGVPAQADESQIQKAYRDLMKRYHPDLVGRPGTREWQDAQKIAEAINRAKEEMLKKLQSQSPRRSGR